MKIKSADFVVSALAPESFPQTHFPEFALIGRSNVGKSSLINLLTERRGLSKVSTTPGKTVMINFFKINGSWFLVDLPGYGFAKVAKTRREDFNDLVATYIETRPNLACLFVLIDARLPPQPIDLQFIEQLSSVAVNFALVFTKIDKQSPTRTRESIEAFTTLLRKRRAELPPIFTTSITTQAGKSEIHAAIDRLCSEARAKPTVRSASSSANRNLDPADDNADRDDDPTG
ncbi:MAG: YihA family ribosome biogenesis GTP-binding protein [Opitutaceae bacterium]|nr:YihA family ribosome biogenesis GTP-binding protein [Opitutaceae bacterium]